MADMSSIVSILTRYQKQQHLSAEETRVLEQWLAESELHQELFEDISDEPRWQAELAAFKAIDPDPSWQRIKARIQELQDVQSKTMFHWSWRRWVAVAAVVCGILVGVDWLIKHKTGRNSGVLMASDSVRYHNDVAIAPTQPFLTLSSGSKIRLDTVHAGALLAYTEAIKTDSNQLVYRGGTDVQENTLTTPIGTQYQVQLSDGTKVWLNAGSSLQYPSNFIQGYRNVTLRGEAYFEVAHDKVRPFIVHSDSGNVRVLGTHFNVQAYGNHTAAVTTLLEGSIRFTKRNDSVQLTPGQQALTGQSGKLLVAIANAEQTVSWRQNLFWFQDASLPSIMEELQRWYPIDVQFTEPVPNHFTGILPRSHSLIELLRTMEKAGHVTFQINGKQVLVSPRKT